MTATKVSTREEAAGRAARRLGRAIIWTLLTWLALIIVTGGAAFLGFMLAFGPGFLGVAAFAVGMILRHHGDVLAQGDSGRAGSAIAWSTIAAGFFGFPAMYLSKWFADAQPAHRVLVFVSQGMCAWLAALAVVAIVRLLVAHPLRFPWFTAIAGAFAFDVILIRRPGSDQGYATVLIALAMMTGVFWILKLLDWVAQPRDRGRESVRDPLAASVMRFGYGALLVLVIGITFPAWEANTSPPRLLYIVLPISAAFGIESMRRAAHWRLDHGTLALERSVRRALYAGITAAALSGFLFFSSLFSLAR